MRKERATSSIAAAGTPVAAAPHPGSQPPSSGSSSSHPCTCARDEPGVDQALALNDVQKGERQGRVAAREGLQMNVRLRRRRRANRIDHHDVAGRLRQPVLMRMRRRGMRIRAPDHDAGGILGRARIESIRRGSVHIAQGDVPCHVANGVRRDLGRAQPIEKSASAQSRRAAKWFPCSARLESCARRAQR